MLLAALLEDREELVDLTELRGLAVRLVKGTDLEVLEHGHLREDPASLRHVTDPELDGLVCREARDVDAVEPERALGRVVQSRDHPERGRLAGAVRAEQGDDLTLIDRDREIVQGRDGAITDLHACHFEKRHQSPPAPESSSLSGDPR